MAGRSAHSPGPVCERECAREVSKAGEAEINRIGFSWIVLPRDGRRPLAVMGRLLFCVSNKLDEQKAWSFIEIYETSEDRIACSIRHHWPAPVDVCWTDTTLCDDTKCARWCLSHHDPLVAAPLPLVPQLTTQLYSGLASAGKIVEAAAFRARWVGMVCALIGPDQPWLDSEPRRSKAGAHA